MNVSFMVMGPLLPTYVINDVDPNITIQDLQPIILQRLKSESNLNITPQNSIQKIFLKGKERTNTETLIGIGYSPGDKLIVRLSNQEIIVQPILNRGLPANIERLPEYIENSPSTRNTRWMRELREYRDKNRYDDSKVLNSISTVGYAGSHRRHHGRRSKKRVTRSRKNKRQSRRYAH
jgi:hypothetical protein